MVVLQLVDDSLRLCRGLDLSSLLTNDFFLGRRFRDQSVCLVEVLKRSSLFLLKLILVIDLLPSGWIHDNLWHVSLAIGVDHGLRLHALQLLVPARQD